MLQKTLSSAEAPRVSTRVAEEVPFDPQSLRFEDGLIDEAIAESGLIDEFDLTVQDMRRLAVNANALMSLAVCAPSDEEYEQLLGAFEPPRRIEEVGFLFGFCEHVRQQLLEALATTGRAEEFRLSIRRRIERAHALCRKAVLSA